MSSSVPPTSAAADLTARGTHQLTVLNDLFDLLRQSGRTASSTAESRKS